MTLDMDEKEVVEEQEQSTRRGEALNDIDESTFMRFVKRLQFLDMMHRVTK